MPWQPCRARPASRCRSLQKVVAGWACPAPWGQPRNHSLATPNIRSSGLPLCLVMAVLLTLPSSCTCSQPVLSLGIVSRWHVQSGLGRGPPGRHCGKRNIYLTPQLIQTVHVPTLHSPAAHDAPRIGRQSRPWDSWGAACLWGSKHLRDCQTQVPSSRFLALHRKSTQHWTKQWKRFAMHIMKTKGCHVLQLGCKYTLSLNRSTHVGAQQSYIIGMGVLCKAVAKCHAKGAKRDRNAGCTVWGTPQDKKKQHTTRD
jgi:hypothetical protein